MLLSMVNLKKKETGSQYLMSTLLEHLNKETLPADLVAEFVTWCVWQQTQPALVRVLQAAGLHEDAQRVTAAADLDMLDEVLNATNATRSDIIANDSKPLRISALEATFNLMQRLVEAAHDRGWDPEGVAFFSRQVCGWAGFAETAFTDIRQKEASEQRAQDEQIAHLSLLWQRYSEAKRSHV